jgi:hypothetical protein
MLGIFWVVLIMEGIHAFVHAIVKGCKVGNIGASLVEKN